MRHNLAIEFIAEHNHILKLIRNWLLLGIAAVPDLRLTEKPEPQTMKPRRARRDKHRSVGRSGPVHRREILWHVGASRARCGECSRSRIDSTGWICSLGWRRGNHERAQRIADHLV